MTETDRKLLELAAKAAGLVGEWKEYEDTFGETCGFVPIGAKTGRDWWNPLTDDGDALRLAVDLRMELDLIEARIAVRVPQGLKILEDISRDPYATTRRAIVRAAAALATPEGGNP